PGDYVESFSSMATTNSSAVGPLRGSSKLKGQSSWKAQTGRSRWSLFLGTWIFFWALSFELGASRAAAAEVRVTSVPARPQRLYQEAKARWRKETNSVEAAWQFGRAAFDLAELATTDASRAALANEGIEACRRAIAINP